MRTVINRVGHTYGYLTVIRCIGVNKRGAMWLCKCKCGRTASIPASRLQSGKTRSCGCLKREFGKTKLVDETGNVYGNLTVLYRTKNSNGGCAKWMCLCKCGKQHTVRGSVLRSGGAKSCGCMRGNSVAHIIDETGNRYGKLLVLEESNIINKYGIMWKCVCDCGITVDVWGLHLRSGKTKDCGCSYKAAVRKNRGEAAFRDYMRSKEKAARARGYEWRLSEKQVRIITKQNCFYCGVEPKQVHKGSHLGGPYIYNGLDRMDNTRGYIIDNVVACCGQCNRAKWTMTFNNFRVWVERLCKHHYTWKDAGRHQIVF